MPRPTHTQSWQTLAALAARPSTTRQTAGVPSALRPQSACGITLDLSRQDIDAAAYAALTALVSEMGLAAKACQLVAGQAVNPTEARPVWHTLLRRADETSTDAATAEFGTGVRHQLSRIEKFTHAIRAGNRHARSIADQAYTDVVVIGIGGSALGPLMAVTALRRFADGPRLHFVSNIDGAALADTLLPLMPATTLVMVISKTFTTEETTINANAAAAWLTAGLGAEAFARQFVAITANPAEAARQGYTADNTFVFWDAVGGRYSLWSAVGLPVALAIGFEHFSQLLAGAAAMDQHFATAPFAENLPMLAAAVGIWNRNFRDIGVHAVLPYAERLARLPNYLQQLEMESNGKSVDLDGVPVDYATCPVIFGEAGTNGQHSFYQLFHQGTHLISSDIIILNERESAAGDQHHRLLANALAQASALWCGHAPAGLDAHKVHVGGRPVTLIELRCLDAFHLGALLAFYEHKVFAQGVLWHINSYDQWGVELGKTIAREMLPRVAALPGGANIVGQFSMPSAGTATTPRAESHP